jgi:hypothetical protein
MKIKEASNRSMTFVFWGKRKWRSYLCICTKLITSYRDLRGFAIKFYSDEGIWDLVGFSTPIFSITDPILFPSNVHAFKRNPVTHIKVRIILESQMLEIKFSNKPFLKALSYHFPFIVSETMVITTSSYIVKN